MNGLLFKLEQKYNNAEHCRKSACTFQIRKCKDASHCKPWKGHNMEELNEFSGFLPDPLPDLNLERSTSFMKLADRLQCSDEWKEMDWSLPSKVFKAMYIANNNQIPEQSDFERLNLERTRCTMEDTIRYFNELQKKEQNQQLNKQTKTDLLQNNQMKPLTTLFKKFQKKGYIPDKKLKISNMAKILQLIHIKPTRKITSPIYKQ